MLSLCLSIRLPLQEGVKVPDVLVPFMGGRTFIPFVRPKPVAVSSAPPRMSLPAHTTNRAWSAFRSVSLACRCARMLLLAPLLLPRDDTRHSCAWTDFPGLRLTSGAMKTAMPAR